MMSKNEGLNPKVKAKDLLVKDHDHLYSVV